MARVVIDNISKVFPGGKAGPVRAVDGLQLTVADRELLALVGPSGCGKTTTLRLIAGLEEPTGGALSIDGKSMNGVPPKDRDVAMVFQSSALYPHMTVEENLGFGLKLRRVPSSEITERVREAAEWLGLMTCLTRLPRELSGGQRQRVALGRALVRRPKLLLLDEPLSNLDAPLRAQMRGEIRRLLARLGAAAIYVTHDQAEAMAMGDHVAVMNEGAIQQIDDALTLYRRPANRFVAGFFGSPAMNFFTGTLRCAPNGWRFEEATAANASVRISIPLDLLTAKATALIAGMKIILGLRPEHFAIASSGTESLTGNEIEARIETVEQLGPEALLHCSTGAPTFAVKVSADHAPPAGARIRLTFDPRHLHLFDAEDGRRFV